MYLVLAVLTGGLVAIMIEANGELQGLAGALPALLAIHLSGLTTTGAYSGVAALRRLLAPRRRPLGGRAAAPVGPAGEVDSRTRGASTSGRLQDEQTARTPVWFLAAGVLGVAAVFLNNEVYRHGGVVLTLMGTLAGQTISAQLFEKSRWFEHRQSPFLQRLLSLLLILPGTILIGLWSHVGLLWVFISWLPGGVLMVQQMMNARNALRFGSQTMLLFNYTTALAALGLLAASSPGLLAGAATRVANAPFPILFGGGFLGVMIVGFSSFLFGRAPALQVVLGMYAGQIVVGIVLDTVSSRPLSAVNLAGVAMVVTGLLIGEAYRFRERSRAGGAR